MAHDDLTAETRRNIGGGSFVRIWPSGEWTILHVRSGGMETTTSLREHDAWPLALALSPALARRYEELFAEVRDLRAALFQFQHCDPANAQLLRRVAEEWDCTSSCDKFHVESDTGAMVCSEEDRAGCRSFEAQCLRDLAAAMETRADLPVPTERVPA